MNHKMGGMMVVAYVVASCVVVSAGEPTPVPGQESNSVTDEARMAEKKTVDVQEAGAKKLEKPVKFTNSVGMSMVLIPAGEFQMGAPEDEEYGEADETLHRVRITQPFYLGACEVTQSQYAAVMGAEPWKGKKYGPWVFVKEGPNHAATHVSRDDAEAFCRRLSKKERRVYRLPTEAEWEYSCRAGTTTAFQCGENESSLAEYGWYRENTYDVGERYAHQVGQKEPNAWGLYDMHGNVWEWCTDWFSYDYYDVSPVDDPPGPASGTSRVARGGSWGCDAFRCRSAYRSLLHADTRYDFVGFRVALGLPK